MLLYNRLHGAILCLIQALTRLKTLTYQRYEQALSVLNIRLYIYLIIAFLFHVLPCKVSAQEAEPVADKKMVDLTSLGLQIGQKMPDLTLTNVHNYKSSSINLSDFKGKLLILDFWATWCSPCVAVIPRMDSLQKEFGDKVQFLSVTYQKDEEVLPFLEKFEKQKGRHYNIPLVNADKELHQLFPHRTLPHYVWIDGEGKVVGITGQEEITYDNIQKLSRNDKISLREKKDLSLAYDKNEPLFFKEPSIPAVILRQSTLSPYIEGVGQGYSQTVPIDDGKPYKRITIRNATIEDFFKYSVFKETKETIVETSEVISFRQLDKDTDPSVWLAEPGNAFCYELIIDSARKSKANDIFKKDLRVVFPKFDAFLDKRKVRCLTLVRTSDRDKVRTKGSKPEVTADRFGMHLTSCYPAVFINRMKFYLQSHPLPLADGTGYTDMIDLDLNCNLSNVDELNRELAKYDLRFVEKETEIEMLVIKDRIN